MEIKSPLTNLSNVMLEYAVKTNFIIDKWKESNIDVARFFNNLPEIYLYKCLDTGYKFYYPFNLEGDNQFYKDLQKFPWYYMDWKWEYDEAYKLIGLKEKILEIGCGKGDFIKKLSQAGINCAGLEFNEEAIKKCRDNGLAVGQETIQEHAKNNQAAYDTVCSFQVMEHITEIGKALTASLAALKPGGKLIISVPNDNSFLGEDKKNLMNMPPHHQGLWNETSLKNLEKYYNLKLQKIYFEPLQTYHYRYYYEVILGKTIKRYFGTLGKFVNLIFARISLYLLVHTDLPKKIKGHSIMAVFIKNI